MPTARWLVRFRYASNWPSVCALASLAVSLPLLQLENILMMEEDTLKISDFGFAADVPDDQPLTGMVPPCAVEAHPALPLVCFLCSLLPFSICTELCGTPGYLSPEMIRAALHKGDDLNRGYSYAVDLWGCGVILYTLYVSNACVHCSGVYPAKSLPCLYTLDIPQACVHVRPAFLARGPATFTHHMPSCNAALGIPKNFSVSLHTEYPPCVPIRDPCVVGTLLLTRRPCPLVQAGGVPALLAQQPHGAHAPHHARQVRVPQPLLGLGMCVCGPCLQRFGHTVTPHRVPCSQQRELRARENTHRGKR